MKNTQQINFNLNALAVAVMLTLAGCGVGNTASLVMEGGANDNVATKQESLLGNEQVAQILEERKENNNPKGSNNTPSGYQREESKQTTANENKEENKQTADNKSSRPFSIVLMHGLGRPAKDFVLMRRMLESAYPQADITVLDERRTHGDSVKTQAERAFKELNTTVNKNNPLVVIGHSQGGLRGACLLKNYPEITNGQKLLITIGTPWNGVPIISHNDAPRFVEALNSKNLGFLGAELHGLICNNHRLGIADILPDSDLLQEVQGYPSSNTLVIAGQTNNKAITNIYPALGKGLNMQAMLSDTHDAVIPVASQLGTGSLNDNVHRKTVVGGLIHGGPPKLGTVPSAMLSLVAAAAPELEHAGIMSEVVFFINEKLVLNGVIAGAPWTNDSGCSVQ